MCSANYFLFVCFLLLCYLRGLKQQLYYLFRTTFRSWGRVQLDGFLPPRGNSWSLPLSCNQIAAEAGISKMTLCGRRLGGCTQETRTSSTLSLWLSMGPGWASLDGSCIPRASVLRTKTEAADLWPQNHLCCIFLYKKLRSNLRERVKHPPLTGAVQGPQHLWEDNLLHEASLVLLFLTPWSYQHNIINEVTKVMSHQVMKSSLFLHTELWQGAKELIEPYI